MCLVLGAGASLANAQHFHPQRRRETWPPLDTTFFETATRTGIPITSALRRYFTEVVGIDPDPMRLREFRMEEVFKDAFFDLAEAPSNRIVLDGYVDLVELYLRVLRVTTDWLCEDNRRGAPIGRLLAEAAGQAGDLTIITFNHDLVIENEIYKRAQLRRRWCLDKSYGSLGRHLQLLFPMEDDPSFPVHADGRCDHDAPITILKLHGSLNWVVRLTSERPTANFLRGQAARGPTNLLTRRHILSGRQLIVREGRGRTSWRAWPVVVPPVYAKQALRSAVQLAWTDARAALRTAERVVCYGYSLSAVDIEAEKLLERALAHSPAPWVDVVNPAPASAARFAGVAKGLPVRWYPSLTSFLAAGGLR